MNIYVSDEGRVNKFIHADGSETAIKFVSSCDTVVDPNTGKIHQNNVERNKYSVFISSSAGCFMKCKFCHLTEKQAKYKKITADAILHNLKSVIHSNRLPSMSSRYLKLCWMGMGEDQIMQPLTTYNVTLSFLNYAMEYGLTKGLDGVDVATVLPKGVPVIWGNNFKTLDEMLQHYPINSCNTTTVHSSNNYQEKYPDRSRLRVFYSLHSAIQNTRDFLIPNAIELEQSIKMLKDYTNGNAYNVIFHHLLFDGVNDTPDEIDSLLRFMKNFPNHELRILRYNPAPSSVFRESTKFDVIIEKLARELPFLKVQISTGTSINAACGQFIVSDSIRNPCK